MALKRAAQVAQPWLGGKQHLGSQPGGQPTLAGATPLSISSAMALSQAPQQQPLLRQGVPGAQFSTVQPDFEQSLMEGISMPIGHGCPGGTGYGQGPVRRVLTGRGGCATSAPRRGPAPRIGGRVAGPIRSRGTSLGPPAECHSPKACSASPLSIVDRSAAELGKRAARSGAANPGSMASRVAATPSPPGPTVDRSEDQPSRPGSGAANPGSMSSCRIGNSSPRH